MKTNINKAWAEEIKILFDKQYNITKRFDAGEYIFHIIKIYNDIEDIKGVKKYIKKIKPFNKMRLSIKKIGIYTFIQLESRGKQYRIEDGWFKVESFNDIPVEEVEKLERDVRMILSKGEYDYFDNLSDYIRRENRVLHQYIMSRVFEE